VILIDVHRLDLERPSARAAYALPLAKALLELPGYEAWWPGRPEPDGAVLRLNLDGSVPRRPRSVAFVYDLAHLARRRLLAPGAWLRQNWSVAAAARRAALVVAPSRWLAAGLSRYLRVTAGSIAVVPPGLDPGFERASRTEVARLRERRGLPDSYFVTFGGVRRRRNLALLEEAWRTAGLQGARLITADDADPDLAPLLSGATAYLDAGLAEGCPTGVLRAMACGTPPLVSGDAAMPEVSGGAGIVLDPDDTGAWAAAITLVVRRPELRADLSRRSRALAAGFSARSAAETLDRALRPYR
jgi:glycosyltransferase involved in cell wall biosynthesis